MTRASYHWMAEKLATNPSYNLYYQVPEEVKYELLFWEANIRILKGFEINPSQSLSESRLTIVPDASADGAFGFEISDRYRVILRQSFSNKKRRRAVQKEKCNISNVGAQIYLWYEHFLGPERDEDSQSNGQFLFIR